MGRAQEPPQARLRGPVSASFPSSFHSLPPSQVPGDYNLALLDELEKEEGLSGVWCCNELNAGLLAGTFPGWV